MTAKEIIEKENIIIKNGAFYKRVCLENCPKNINGSNFGCKRCEHEISKQDFDIVYDAIQHNQI